MPARDSATLGFYAEEAEIYAGREREADLARIERFARLLPAGGQVLELGCGGGQDSAALLARGFDVTPTDGSPELAAQAALRLGRPVSVLLFEDLVASAAYDGVWANACLLHVPRAALPAIIAKVHAALRPGAAFYASFKAGEAEGRDRFGRYYNYPSADWLREAYGDGAWSSLDIIEEAGGGYDREPTLWLHAFAIKIS
jgi:SAM-dependent methyltransferase